MPFRTSLLRAAAVATAGLLALPATPAWAAETTVVDILKVIDGEYVVETVRVPTGTAAEKAEDLEERPDVVVASPQVTYELDASGYDPYWDPTDPQEASKVREVWDRTRGEGQVVAVLDSAIESTHADLSGAMLPGTDTAGGPGSNWHGTGVAGVIAARAENGLGSAGMAPAAKILPVRVCNDTGCPSAAIARGILWAADHGADVINMSLSGKGYSDVSAAAVQYALDKGISVVAATGNDGLNGNPVMYPAALSGVIGVSSTTPTGAVSDWAVHGWQTDVSTVGDSVLLTMPGNAYGSGSGTSFSTPAVAGAVALLRSAHPGITPQEVQAALQAGSDNSGTWDRAYGAGRLDVPAAMAAADRLAESPTVIGSSGAVDVGWAPEPGATSYTVRLDGVARAEVSGTSARVTGLTVGNQVAVDVQPENGPRSSAALATVAPTAPATPTLHSASLRGTVTSAILDLSASVTGPVASQYALIRDGVSIGNITMALTATPKTFAIGIGAMPSTQVRWQVRPVDSYARVGAASNSVTTGTAVPAPPGAPTGLTGRIQDGEVLLTWDDLGSAYTYRVSVEGSPVASPRTAGVVLPAPPRGETRTYEVAVADTWSQVGPSATTSVAQAATAPGAPVIGTATPGDGSVLVRWTPPSDDGGGPLTGYTVTARVGGVPVTATSAGPSALSATVTGLTNGTAHTFTVAASNSAGTGTTSAASAPVTPGAPISAPGAPAVSNVAAGDGSLAVDWTAPSSTGGSPITGYTAHAHRDGVVVASVDVGPAVRMATVPGLTNGTSYTLTVTATNVVGAGPASAHSAAVAPRTVPGAPRITKTAPGRGTLGVRWTAPTSTGGAAISGYQIRVHLSGRVVRTTTVGAGTSTTSITGLTNGKKYSVAVAATNAAGTGPLSALSGAITPRTVPGAPKITSKSAARKAVVLKWAAPASNGGASITSYVVRIYTGGKHVRSVTVSASTRSVKVTKLTPGRGYTFRVLASNVAGKGATSAASQVMKPKR